MGIGRKFNERGSGIHSYIIHTNTYALAHIHTHKTHKTRADN